MATYQHPFLSVPYGDYTWCSECLRVYRTASWVAQEWRCPNPDCRAAASYAWRWEAVRKRKQDYPEEPEDGVVYTLYGG